MARGSGIKSLAITSSHNILDNQFMSLASCVRIAIHVTKTTLLVCVWLEKFVELEQ